jgi:hypothetical protein
LARSISEIGLLHPIVVRPDGILIAGERRLAAYKYLGLPEIPARTVDLDEVLVGEFAENSCRKDFTPSELVAIGRAMHDLEREKARQRQIELGKSQGDPSGKFPEGCKGQTRDRVAAALGVSGRTYEKAAQIVEAADKEPERFGHLVKEMDRTGKVDGPYRTLRSAQAEERPLGLDGATQEVRDAADADARSAAANLSAAATRPADGKSAAAVSEHMHLCLTISLRPIEIDALTCRGLLRQEQRHNPNAVRDALSDLLLLTLAEPYDT